jgi:predicted transcriptional regulator
MGSARSKDEIIQSIVDLASKAGEFTAEKGRDTDLVIEKKIVDAAYGKVAGAEKITKTYRACILFDESTREAKYNEELIESSDNVDLNSSSTTSDGDTGIGGGTMSFGTSKKLFRGRMLAHKEMQKTWGIKPDMTPGKVVDYFFDVKSIRNPIERLLNENGWKLVQVLSRKEASYKKKGWFNF